MLRNWSRAAALLSASWLGFVGSARMSAAEEADRAALDFFETKIRPVLVSKCYECHSAESQEIMGGLRVDSREAIRQGGDSGPAVVPGNVGESLILAALRYEDLEMPPTEKLSEQVVADFQTWIEKGAADPRDETPVAKSQGPNYDEARKFWSFQPLTKTDLAQFKPSPWARSDLDRFIAAKWDSKGLQPVADATKSELIRRAYFDLIGLPPTAEEVAAFEADASPAAFEKVVDHLLASPHFGERWGRHWLDTARYADSNGRQKNIYWQFAWHYRDYVIDAFNTDKPYDQFIVEQVAGDLLPAAHREQRDRQRVATGFLALGSKNFDTPQKEQFVMDLIDEQIDVTSRSVMGLTVSCARCHDHKFDPVPTKEYYAWAGIFRSTHTLYGPSFVQTQHDHKYHLYAIGQDAQRLGEAAFDYREKLLQAMRDRNHAAVVAYRTQRAIEGLLVGKPLPAPGEPPYTTPELEKLRAQHKAELAVRQQHYDAVTNLLTETPPLPDFALGVMDKPQPEDCTLRIRGDFDRPGAVVPRGVLTLFTPQNPAAIPPANSGRLELAKWLVDRGNPLTGRVAVNRVWQHLFGVGIVKSADNFGTTGELPTHPELIDHLAARFMDSGWSTKRLIREIMLSRVYQLSSHTHPGNDQIDAANDFLWRMNRRRLEVEPLRDATLAVSGSLQTAPPRGPHPGLVRFGLVEEDEVKLPELHKLQTESPLRTVYLPIVRNHLPEMLTTFDFADPNMVIARRDERTIPSQSLFMLNSPWVWTHARKTAERATALPNLDDSGRLDWIYRTALARRPSPTERDALLKFVLQESASPEPTESSRLNAWTSVCHAVMASAEFRYLD